MMASFNALDGGAMAKLVHEEALLNNSLRVAVIGNVDSGAWCGSQDVLATVLRPT